MDQPFSPVTPVDVPGSLGWFSFAKTGSGPPQMYAESVLVRRMTYCASMVRRSVNSGMFNLGSATRSCW